MDATYGTNKPRDFFDDFFFFMIFDGFSGFERIPAALGTSCYPYSIPGYRYFIKNSIFEKSEIL